MYDLSELEPTTKEVAMGIIVVVIVLASAFAAGYLLGWERTCDVHDHGTGTGNAGEQLGTAISNQQQITDGIQNAEHTSSGIAETSQAIAESAGHIEARVGEAAGLIDSSQQILGRIRNRGQEGKAPH